MQVWNLLQAARCKHRTQKSRQKSPSGHHCTTLSGYIFATKARIDNRKKLAKHQYVLHMSPQYGELRHTSGWHRLTSLGYPCKYQLVLRLGSVTARHLVVGVSQTLRRWSEGATYIRQGDYHVGHWPTFLVHVEVWNINNYAKLLGIILTCGVLGISKLLLTYFTYVLTIIKMTFFTHLCAHNTSLSTSVLIFFQIFSHGDNTVPHLR